MQRAVIAIGVRKTGGLPVLQAAVQGAQAFAEWARVHQRIRHVRLLTDEKRRVTRDAVFKAVKAVADLGYIEQLIVYFSGHGINVGLEERWLLSDAPEDAGAAVNVKGSELSARFCGIGHVVFVSDACRTAADSIHAQHVSGASIFPNLPPSGPEKPVDLFYATLLGQPALEVKSVDAAAAAYRAAYSDVLLKALRGDVPELLEPDTVGRVVRAWPLKTYLQDAVPQYLRQLQVAQDVTQQPDAHVSSNPRAWLSLCPPEAPGTPDAATAGARKRRGIGPRTPPPGLGDRVILPPTAMEHDARRPGGLLAEGHAALRALLRPDSSLSARRRSVLDRRFGAPARTADGGPSVARVTEMAASAFGPDQFETRCGLKVRGARVVDAVAAPARASVRVGPRQDAVQVQLRDGVQAATVLLALEDGSSVLIPAFAGQVAALTFDADGLLEDLAYEPSANTAAYAAYQRSAPDVRRLRAVVAGTSALGVFRLDDPRDAESFVARLLATEALDPAMAVLAAYELDRRRMREAIRALDRTLADRLGVHVFDVALLTFSTEWTRQAAPQVPLLTQGWSLLQPLGVSLPAGLDRLRGQLRPSLWTQFAAGTAAVLIETVRSGKVG